MRTVSLFGFAFALALIVTGAIADEAADTFNQIFGPQVKAVAATRDTADDLALARRLLEVARTSTSTPDLLAVLCDNAYDLAAKAGGDDNTAAAAMQFVAEHLPERRNESLEKIALLRRRAYVTARGDARTAAGETFIDALLAQSAARENPDDASGDLRQAMSVAAAIRSPRTDNIRARYEQLNAQRAQLKRADELRRKLKADPADKASAEALMQLYIVELDQPDQAQKYTFLLPDTDWAKNVSLAARDVTTLSEPEASSLGDWYRQLAPGTSTPQAQSAMLSRALHCYEHAQRSNPSTELGKKRLELALADVQQRLTQLGVNAAPANSPVGPVAQQATPAPVAPEAGEIELIDKMSFPESLIRGNWRKEGRVIRGGETEDARFMLPLAVDGDYRLTLDFVRTEGQDSLAIVAPIASRQFQLTINSSPSTGGLSGITLAEHGMRDPANHTVVKGTPIQNGRRHTLVMQVRTPGPGAGSIIAQIDGRPLVQWNGPVNEIPESMRQFQPPFADAINIGTWKSMYAFGSIRLKMLNGTARPVALSPPLAKLAPVGKPTYLSDLPEQDVHVLIHNNDPLFRKGHAAGIRIAGVHSPHGLLTHPGKGDPAHVNYDLNGQYRLLVGAVGISDRSNGPQSEVWYSILGDGKVLWRSRPIQWLNKVEPFAIDVSGVQSLQLSASVSSGDSEAHAVWVEPTLYPQARETDRVIFADLTPNAPMQRDKPVNKAPQPVGDDRTDDPSTGGSFFGIPTE